MMDELFAVYLFCFLTGVGVFFQIALILGAPWGEMTMSGRFPGRLPYGMRIAALVQSFLLVFIALVVLTRSGLVLPQYYALSQTFIWIVVAFLVLGSILNTISPSKKERRLWAPVNLLLLICALVVATN